jgi:hypothetical protein
VSAAAEVAEETIGAILDDSTDVVAAAMNAVECSAGRWRWEYYNLSLRIVI